MMLRRTIEGKLFVFVFKLSVLHTNTTAISYILFQHGTTDEQFRVYLE